MNIIGIDPGSIRAGYGVISFNKKEPSFISGGILPISTTKRPDVFVDLYTSLVDLIQKHKPTYAGIETLYVSKNKKTAIEVAQAQGVFLLAFAQHNIPIYTFTPNQIKQSLTGYGSAPKKNVQQAVEATLRLKDFSDVDDAFDALAVAITTAFFSSSKLTQYS